MRARDDFFAGEENGTSCAVEGENVEIAETDAGEELESDEGTSATELSSISPLCSDDDDAERLFDANDASADDETEMEGEAANDNDDDSEPERKSCNEAYCAVLISSTVNARRQRMCSRIGAGE